MRRDHCKRCQLKHGSKCLVVFVHCSVYLPNFLLVFLYCMHVHVCNAP